MILITPPETMNSSVSPALMWARRWTLGGTESCVLRLTVMVTAATSV